MLDLVKKRKCVSSSSPVGPYLNSPESSPATTPAYATFGIERKARPFDASSSGS